MNPRQRCLAHEIFFFKVLKHSPLDGYIRVITNSIFIKLGLTMQPIIYIVDILNLNYLVSNNRGVLVVWSMFN